jgi:hypothetical protein
VGSWLLAPGYCDGLPPVASVTTPRWMVAAAIEGAKFEPTGWKERGGQEWQIPKQLMSHEEAVANLFPTDAEEEAAIAQAILAGNRGEGKPYEQVKAEQDRQHEALVASAVKPAAPKGWPD